MNGANILTNTLERASTDITNLSIFETSVSKTGQMINGLDEKGFQKLNRMMQLQNVGDVGQAIDYSNNQLANPLQNESPLATWLRSTALSQRMRTGSRINSQVFKNPNTGNWEFVLPWEVFTFPQTDTTGECCWVPLEIAKCSDTAPLHLLCLKDCECIMDRLINENRVAGSNDLTGYFLRPGEKIREARRRMARLSMAFFTQRNMILGVSTAETPTLKPFHGLLEVMEDPAVIAIEGMNVLGAFASALCRMMILGGGNWAIAVHPLTYMGIASMITPGRFNTLPNGWTNVNGVIRFNGIPFIQDKLVPVDIANGTGEAWIMDGNYVGVYLATDLMPSDRFIRSRFDANNNPDECCGEDCDYYYNLGTVFGTNPNRLMVINDIPLSAACTGTALQGLDGLITPNTIVPRT